LKIKINWKIDLKKELNSTRINLWTRDRDYESRSYRVVGKPKKQPNKKFHSIKL
jgi:hypothetical protein